MQRSKAGVSSCLQICTSNVLGNSKERERPHCDLLLLLHEEQFCTMNASNQHKSNLLESCTLC